MKASNLFIHTSRENPTDAELISHSLMIRAGLIRKLVNGIFSWLPLGLRVVNKVAQIVREEMNRTGAAEIMMPAVQPAELWEESGRWKLYGKELLRLEDRHGRHYCIGPTHEEVVTDIVRSYVRSWRHLPINLYQIQTKFRDEIRPRFGVMRAREFVMKDAYSFDIDVAGAKHSYKLMREAYTQIFDRIGLDYRIIEADTGTIGGSNSEEFVVLSDTGELVIGFTDDKYAANLELVPCPRQQLDRPEPSEKMVEFATPEVTSIDTLAGFMKDPPPMHRLLKTMIVTGETGSVAVLLRGKDSLNLAKAAKLPEIGTGAILAEQDQVNEIIGAHFGSLGPVNMKLPVIADYGVENAHDFVCGANKDGYHLSGVNFGRDTPEPKFADLRFAYEGETAPDNNPLKLRRGIEVGHIFNLGDKYSVAMDTKVESKKNKLQPVIMGCYGIGITRIVAAAIEQNNDDDGIIFPESIAPFTVAVLPLGKEDEVIQTAQTIYQRLDELGIDVLLEDRDLRAGAIFADLDLIGIPHRLVISKRSLAQGKVEHKRRVDGQVNMLDATDAATQFGEILASLR